MKWIKRVGLAIASLLLLLFVVSFFLPSKWRVERSVVIKRPPDVIYPYLADLRKWPQWTAWTTNRDPTLTYSFEGNKGAGAIQRWTSQKLGNGALTIKVADPRKGIWFDLQMENGKFTALGMILFQKSDEGTKVIWINEGELGGNVPGRYFALCFDRLMGPDLAKGLEKLKRLV